MVRRFGYAAAQDWTRKDARTRMYIYESDHRSLHKSGLYAVFHLLAQSVTLLTAMNSADDLIMR